MRVAIVGASRGIGREFARQYAEAGDTVLATHRHPDHAAALRALGAVPIALDVRDNDAAARLSAALGRPPVDCVILNAGLYGPRTTTLAPPARLDFDAVMHTNVLGPMRLMPALAAHLPAGGRLAVISSKMGSVSTLGSAHGWLYRASKAALNAALKAASHELGVKGIVCIALHPGWVRTDMGGAGAELDVTTSVTGMRRVIAAADRQAHGRFFNYDGSDIAW